MNAFLNDLRFALRQLISKPGFAAAAILTLALGIGANTAVFSYLSGYLLKPLPYPHSGRLVEVGSLSPKMFKGMWPISPPTYRVIKTQTNAFESSAVFNPGIFDLQKDGRAKRVFGIYSSPSLFDVLGVRPLLGQPFTPDNTHKGNNHVVLISYGMWRTDFGASPDVIGKSIKLDGSVWKVIGVMPKGFAFPNRNDELWIPATLGPKSFSPNRFLALGSVFIGRLNPGVSFAAAKEQVQHAVNNYVQEKVPADLRQIVHNTGYSIGIQSWHQLLLGDRASTLWLLQGAVLLILLMTCVNVANLLLSRILGRSHEIAMRSTLGATRTMLARQLLGEALCLTVPGGLIGVALAALALHFWAGSVFGASSAIFSVTLDWRVGLFALGSVLFTAAVVSVLPIRHLAKANLQTVLQEGGRTASGGRRTRRVRSALIIAELTLATGLLAIAGLVLHSFMNLENINPGFRTDHVLMASMLVPPTDHQGPKALSSFYIDLVTRVESLPGVDRAAVATVLPLGQNSNLLIVTIPGRTRPTSGKPPAAMINNVTPSYFKTLGIPILRGRGFRPRGSDNTAAIVDAGFAHKYFPDSNPIGQQIQLGPKATKYTIVGVVPSVKYAKLSQSKASVTIYLNSADTPFPANELAIQTTLPPSALIKPLKHLVASIDPNLAMYDVQTMQQHLAASLLDKQAAMTLLLAFGGIALALAIVGVYAVMSYAVGQRRAECGVRLALGALPEDLSWLILKDGFRLLAVGLVIGLGLAVLAGYAISSQLFGVAPFDPLTLIGSAIILCIITLIACWLPARRAAKVDPAVAIMEQ